MAGDSKTRVWLIAAAGVAVAVAVTVIIVIGVGAGGGSDAPSDGQVKIELRGKPAAAIRMNGKPIGNTPTVIVVPRGSVPIELEATFVVEKLGIGRRPSKKTEIWRQTKSIVPDAEQSVDFAQSQATKIDEQIEIADPVRE